VQAQKGASVASSRRQKVSTIPKAENFLKTKGRKPVFPLPKAENILKNKPLARMLGNGDASPQTDLLSPRNTDSPARHSIIFVAHAAASPGAPPFAFLA